MFSKNTQILLIFNFLIIFAIFIISGSTSVLISLISFYVISSIFILRLSKGNNFQRKDLFTLYNVSFLFYIIFGFLAYLSYTQIDGYFIFSDQIKFYDLGDELGNLSSVSEIFQMCFIERIHLINEGILFLFGILAYFANLFDGNSVLFQILNVTYFGIIINLFVYKTLLFYSKRNLALKYSIYYSLFTYVICFSPWILRDIHIALFFAIAIYIVHLPFSIKRFIYLLILQIVVLEFRLVSGAAFVFFPLIYIYLKTQKSNNKFIYYTFLVLIIALMSIKNYDSIIRTYDTISGGYQSYSKYSLVVAEDQGGLGAKLLVLPNGLKQFAILIYSQISPFPPWDQLFKAKTFLQFIFGIIFMISPVFWGFVVYVVTFNMKKYYKLLSSLHVFLLLFFIIFLLGNSSNLNLRRVICVYPILYFIFIFFISKMSKSKLNSYIYNYGIIYMLLIVAYVLLKMNF